MESEAVLSGLPNRHANALRWFCAHAGTEQPWPRPLPGQTLLVSKAKGIYKPKWSEYALSVRESLRSRYDDLDPVSDRNGRWTYRYHQENLDAADRDREYTNRALIRCMEDHVPVGVMRQVADRPKRRYEILGIGIVTNWENGYFTITALG